MVSYLSHVPVLGQVWHVMVSKCSETRIDVQPLFIYTIGVIIHNPTVTLGGVQVNTS